MNGRRRRSAVVQAMPKLNKVVLLWPNDTSGTTHSDPSNRFRCRKPEVFDEMTSSECSRSSESRFAMKSNDVRAFNQRDKACENRIRWARSIREE